MSNIENLSLSQQPVQQLVPTCTNNLSQTVPTTCTTNLSQPVSINLYYKPCTSITHTTYTITSASTMHNTSSHNNLSHQPHQPNKIYSPISITKTTLNHMHTITKMCITQHYSQTPTRCTNIKMFF
jgi:hypothetical protein